MTLLDTIKAPLAKLPRPDLSHILGARRRPCLGKTMSFRLYPDGVYFNPTARFGRMLPMRVFGETWAVLAAVQRWDV